MSGSGSRKKRRALGRGLDALLPEKTEPGPGEAKETTLPLSRIQANPDQPRRTFDQEALDSLAQSLKHRGLIQPIVVRSMGRGRYQIIAGERRFRAARQVGLEEIPVIVREASEDEALEVSLIENVQREDLNAIDTASAYLRLMEEHGYSQDQVAAVVGKNRSTVANTLRLLSLPEGVQQMVVDGLLSEGHARAVLQAQGAGRQLQVARQAMSRGLSVRETEKLARSKPDGKSARKPATTSAEVRDLEERLQRALAARVQIKHGRGGRGQLTIRYSSLDELDSILDTILGKKRR